MDAASAPVAAPLYTRLVPASLLPPEDPNAGQRRTARDWIVDIVLMLLAAGWATGYSVAKFVADGASITSAVWVVGGALSVLALWWRRRFPVQVAVIVAVLSAVVPTAGVSEVASMLTVVIHRRTVTALSIAALDVVASAIYAGVHGADVGVPIVLDIIVDAILIAWGMFVRGRRQLVWTVRAQAERAEAEQVLLAERAQIDERTRIAREMHDVLAHRISMIALQAGGLAVRPDLPPAQIGEAAELMRSAAQLALEELREVIGVLRDDATGGPLPSAPQPTLRDLPRLVEETRRAGATIGFWMSVPDDDPPGSLGRDAYRIVQEALTNVTKHARGAATVVKITGGPEDGLHIDVRNQLPPHGAEAWLPGSGSGLIGLRERVTLAGGSLQHGPNDDGEFVVDARLAWP